MLMKHNIPVYKNLCRTLEKYKKAIVVTFTGGGKSFIAHEYLTERQLRALVVCPKRSICEQWRALHPDIAAMTYQTFSRMPIESMAAYEAVILDEAHHCGSPVWGAKAKELMDAATGVVIGMTADPVRWSDGGRDVAEELFEGHIVKGYSLKEAIEQDIVKPFTYVCTIIGLDSAIREQQEKLARDGKKLDRQTYMQAEHLIAQLKLDRDASASVQEVLRQHMPAKPKGIVFTDDIAAIGEARAMMKEVFPMLPCYAVHSRQSQTRNEAQMAAFSAAESACILSVNMLGEGVHVEGVNFVVMLRRTQSPTIFFQQLGRGTAAKSGASLVVFDIVGNRCTLQLAESRKAKALGLFKREGDKKAGQIIVADYAMDALKILGQVDELLSLHKPWTAEEDEILRKHFPAEGRKVCERLPTHTAAACLARAQKLHVQFSDAYKAWTAEEDCVLYQWYPVEGAAVSSRLPGRTKHGCMGRAKALHIRFNECHGDWTAKERAVLTQWYPIEGKNVCARLPGRNWNACSAQATKLGLHRANRCGRKWTEAEDEMIRRYWPTEGSKAAARLPERNAAACGMRAIKLGIHCEGKWTPEEDEMIRKHYPVEGRKIAARLPGRTAGACKARAVRLGICHWNRWTPEEDAILRQYYPIEGRNTAARLHGRSERTCEYRAQVLGITKTKKEK